MTLAGVDQIQIKVQRSVVTALWAILGALVIVFLTGLRMSWVISGWVAQTDTTLAALSKSDAAQDQIDREYLSRITRVETMSQRDHRERQRVPEPSSLQSRPDEELVSWDPDR